MSNVPKLRFKEFSGEWELKQLSKVCELKAGKFVKATDISNIMKDNMFPCYGGNGLRGYTNTFTHNGSYSLIGRQGALCGNIQFANNKFHATEHAVVVTPFDENDTLWLYYQLDRLNLNKFATGQAQPGLSVDVIKNVKAVFPLKPEQEKIASFLTSVDTKIEQLTKKESLLQEYKKGVMQKIFNQEIRFKDDDGSEFCEWEEKKLGDILDYIQPTKYLVKDTEYNDRYTIPVLTAGKTFILGYTNETDGVFENNLPVIIFDDFTTANKFVNFPFKAKSSAMKILTPKDNNNIKFIYEAMQMIKYEVGGHERHWISKFSFLNIFIPYIEEQIKIANFLSSIDTKIEQTQKQLESSKEFKKALLQQMFV
mgnify:CR=1 FL=1|jgi:type I restriction enzyme S subunit